MVRKVRGSTSAWQLEGGINYVDRRRADGPACFGAVLYYALLVSQEGGTGCPCPPRQGRTDLTAYNSLHGRAFPGLRQVCECFPVFGSRPFRQIAAGERFLAVKRAFSARFPILPKAITSLLPSKRPRCARSGHTTLGAAHLLAIRRVPANPAGRAFRLGGWLRSASAPSCVQMTHGHVRNSPSALAGALRASIPAGMLGMKEGLQ